MLSKVSGKVIVVASAGNNFKSGGPINEKLAKDDNLILVGSLHPIGKRSDFSTVSNDPIIYAPSDLFLVVPGANYNYSFGGTSGAQPIVTGSLANAMTLIQPFTVAEAKMVLFKTGLNLNYEGSNLTMVNAYSMVLYAERLRDAGWP